MGESLNAYGYLVMPDSREQLVEKFILAHRHLATGRKIIQRQMALIAEPKRKGRRTLEADRLLDQFRLTLAIFEEEYETLRRRLEPAPKA